MRRSLSTLAISLPAAIGLTILVGACSHGSPKPEEAPPPAPPTEAAPAEPDTSTLSGRLQKLGQEIEAIPENTARRMGPELERIREVRDDLDARLRKDSKVVGAKIKGAVESLEDDLRQMRSRMAKPPPESAPEPPKEE